MNFCTLNDGLGTWVFYVMQLRYSQCIASNNKEPYDLGEKWNRQNFNISTKIEFHHEDVACDNGNLNKLDVFDCYARY